MGRVGNSLRWSLRRCIFESSIKFFIDVVVGCSDELQERQETQQLLYIGNICHTFVTMVWIYLQFTVHFLLCI